MVVIAPRTALVVQPELLLAERHHQSVERGAAERERASDVRAATLQLERDELERRGPRCRQPPLKRGEVSELRGWTPQTWVVVVVVVGVVVGVVVVVVVVD